MLMEETKKYTAALREGCSQEEREEMHNIILGIQKLISEKSNANGYDIPSHHVIGSRNLGTAS